MTSRVASSYKDLVKRLLVVAKFEVLSMQDGKPLKKSVGF